MTLSYCIPLMLEFFTQFLIRDNSFEQINRWFPVTGEELVPEWKAATTCLLAQLCGSVLFFPSLALAVWFHYIIKVPTKQNQAFSNNVIIKIQVTSLLASTLHTVTKGSSWLDSYWTWPVLKSIRWFAPPWVASSRYSYPHPGST